MLNRILIAFFSVLLGALLIGTRFELSWAGGNGFVESVPAGVLSVDGAGTVDHGGKQRPLVENDALVRGEIIKTEGGGRVIIKIGTAVSVALDERTDVLLEDLRPGSITLKLIQGRFLLDTHARAESAHPAITIATAHTKTSVKTGQLSMVNYSFRDTVSVIPIDALAAVVVGDKKGFLTKTPVDIHETDPITTTDFVFDPTTGAAKDFYAWAARAKKSDERF